MKKLEFLILVLVVLFSLAFASCACLHEWEVDLVSSTDSCIDGGEMVYFCKFCGTERREEKANGHIVEIIDAIEPTCERDGCTRGEICSRCSTVIVASEHLDMKGHEYDDVYDDRCNVCDEYRVPNVMFMHGIRPKLGENGMMGYANIDGEFVISPAFLEANPFNGSGYAVVKVVNGHIAVINLDGEYVIEPGTYRTIDLFNSKGYAIADNYTTKEVVVLNTEYEVVCVLPEEPYGWSLSDNGCYIVEKDNRYYIRDLNGRNDRVELPYDNYSIDYFSPNGYASIRVGEGTYKYGFMDESGNVVIEPVYDYVDYFADCGIARVGQKLSGSSTMRYGYINEQGKVIVPIIYEFAFSFGEDGLAQVDLGEMDMFINTRGEIVTEGDFTIVDDWHFSENGLCPAKDLNRKTIYIDRSGNVVINLIDGIPSGFAKCGLARISYRDVTYFINERGEKAISVECTSATNFTDDGYAQCQDTSDSRVLKFFIIDTEGNILEGHTEIYIVE